MQPAYYIIDTATHTQVPATVRPATQNDFLKTEAEQWQTSWLSEFIQEVTLEKYALEISGTQELIGLGAYRDVPDGIFVAVEYI